MLAHEAATTLQQALAKEKAAAKRVAAAEAQAQQALQRAKRPRSLVTPAEARKVAKMASNSAAAQQKAYHTAWASLKLAEQKAQRFGHDANVGKVVKLAKRALDLASQRRVQKAKQRKALAKQKKAAAAIAAQATKAVVKLVKAATSKQLKHQGHANLGKAVKHSVKHAVKAATKKTMRNLQVHVERTTASSRLRAQEAAHAAANVRKDEEAADKDRAEEHKVMAKLKPIITAVGKKPTAQLRAQAQRGLDRLKDAHEALRIDRKHLAQDKSLAQKSVAAAHKDMHAVKKNLRYAVIKKAS